MPHSSGVASSRAEQAEGEIGRNGPDPRRCERKFASATPCRAPRAARQDGHVLGGDEVLQAVCPIDALLPDVEHLGEAPVAVEDRALDAERQGAFLDLLDEHAVGPVGVLQRVDLTLAVRALHDDGVEVARRIASSVSSLSSRRASSSRIRA